MTRKFDLFEANTGTPVLICVLNILQHWMQQDGIIFHHSLWLMVNLLKLTTNSFEEFLPCMTMSDMDVIQIKKSLNLIINTIDSQPSDALFRYNTRTGDIGSASDELLTWCKKLKNLFI